MIQTLNIDYTDKGELSGPGSDFEQDSEKDRNKLEKKMDNIKDRYVCFKICYLEAVTTNLCLFKIGWYKKNNLCPMFIKDGHQVMIR